MEHAEIESQADLVYAEVMETLRDLPWQIREAACASLLYNPEFCWYCGMEKTPPGATCHCQNDE